MLFSRLFAPTSREIPKDAVLKSHIYLLRAGLIHQIGSGIYNFLPLGNLVLNKIKAIIREEMNKSGASEITMGFLTPASLWEKSGRRQEYEELAILKDRRGGELVLGPTHEECASEIAKSYIKSYKQLPINLYQMHLKFRDEARPRFGLLRAREFVMKDAYSFHENTESLDLEFNNMYNTYARIFTRLGFDFRVVEADSGAIGGRGSREFMAIADCGEDTIVICKNCEYASNLEAARRRPKTCDAPAPKANTPYYRFPTDGVKSMQALADFFKVDPFYLIKTVALKVAFRDGYELAFFFLRGGDSLETTKALNAIKAINPKALGLEEVDDSYLQEAGLAPGYLGPIHIRELSKSDLIVFDEELRGASELICGANEEGYHYVGVNLNEFEGLFFYDLVEVKQGDACHKCGGELAYTKGIELGHIFKLGTKYSKPLEANFLDSKGALTPFVMGCYGIGVTRLLSALLEQKADDKGCVWGGVAPYKLDIIISNNKNQNENLKAREIYETCLRLGVEVVLDDRDLRFGAKISDFELIGFEYALIVGKGLAQNKLELIKREGLQRREIDLSEVDSIIENLDSFKF